MTTPLFESQLTSLPLIARGKVRDLYRVDDDRLLMVASDRLSAFDVVLPQPIPDKGRVLTRVSHHWFDLTRDLVPNHRLESREIDALPLEPSEREQLAGRTMLVRQLQPLPVEAIVRGYLIGSGWRDYQRSGAVCGLQLPLGLALAEALPEPIFTPSTKAEVGAHDENIDFAQLTSLIGSERAEQLRALSLALYRFAADYALERGLIIADTKMEFGIDDDGQIHLIDELFTPDSSRYWPVDGYRKGESPDSFDKQFVRDYLEQSGWDKRAPAPELPEAVIEESTTKYRELEQRLIDR